MKSTLVHLTKDNGRLLCGGLYESPATTNNQDHITCNRCRYLLKLPYAVVPMLKVHAPDVEEGTSVTLCGVDLPKIGGIAENSKEISCRRCRAILGMLGP
jgi:hypothetical protein